MNISMNNNEFLIKEYPAIDYWEEGMDKNYWVSRYKGKGKVVEFPETVDGKKICGINERAGILSDSYRNIEKIIIPEGYYEIGARAFKGCENLKEIILPSTLLQIGDEAFCECTSLQTIIIPGKVEQVGKWALRDSGLKEIYVLNPKMNYEGTNWLRGLKEFVVYAMPGTELESKKYAKPLPSNFIPAKKPSLLERMKQANSI